MSSPSSFKTPPSLLSRISGSTHEVYDSIRKTKLVSPKPLNRVVIVISGPTASGKSIIAEELCSKYSGSAIVNADSMQVYDTLPLLSAQPNLQNSSKYNLYSIMSYDQNCSVGLWAGWAHDCIAKLHSVGAFPIVVGGSGLYIQALLDGIACIPTITEEVKIATLEHFACIGQNKFYDELMQLDSALVGKIHANDIYRMQRAMQVLRQTGKSITSFKTIKQEYNYLHVFINPERGLLYKNCDLRFLQMIQAGALEEVRALLCQIQAEARRLTNQEFERRRVYNVEKTLGYQSIAKHVQGKLSLTDATIEAQQLTRNYAKRQMTWFNNKFINKNVINYDEMKVQAIKSELFEMVDKFFK